jgi:uncharacterized protein (DUF697 family)
MANPLKLTNVWRIIRDIDLEAIRRQALAPFEVLVAADEIEDAVRVADLLHPGEPHPWISTMRAGDVQPGETVPLVTLLVTRTHQASAALDAARTIVRTRGGAMLTVRVGETGPAASAPHPGDQARVAVVSLDDPAAGNAIAAALMTLVEGDERLALGRHFAPLRPALFHALIQETAQANASFALTTGLAESVPILTAPLNLGDIVVLTKNQLLLGYRIALGAGRDGEPRAMLAEIVGVLGGGVLFRQIAREMVGLIPVAGIPLKVAVAYSGTWAIGRATAIWVTEGRRVTSDAVQQMSKEAMARGRAVADRLMAERSSGRGDSSRWQRFKGYLPGPRRGDTTEL